MDDVCLVTGGAGFIGCATSTALADRFERVVALDLLHPQVHPRRERPAALDPRVDLIVDDVADENAWERTLTECRPRVVIHLAAETGTAQSLTEASRHAATNVLGTTRMLDAFARRDVVPERIVLASSRAVYGEGVWEDEGGRLVAPGQRTHAMLAAGEWDFPGLRPLPAGDPRMRPAPTSVYGATKLAQEHVLRAWCLALGADPFVVRLQNVYGPGQSLTNPYTGIVSLFVQVARDGRSIPVYEDGQIVRDLVHVDDVARAVVAATQAPPGAGAALDDPLDIGSGVPTTILELASVIAAHYGAPAPSVTGQFRDGDVRAAWAEVGAAERVLGWRPSTTLRDGVDGLCDWVDTQLR